MFQLMKKCEFLPLKFFFVSIQFKDQKGNYILEQFSIKIKIASTKSNFQTKL
jgi:hypothetical protein